ncbi:hypothetical protein [Catenulispora rubra]|uniref:hypothetical protein n=1 Tax=Catenulispora rubra TaxID=280293 RepID=UPI0018924A5B|nr:hypothetical protein [Catenulispora rubra]
MLGGGGTAIDFPPIVIVEGTPEGLLDADEDGAELEEPEGVLDVGGFAESLDVGCGVLGTVVGSELGLELGGVAGLDGLDELDDEPPRPIDSSGVGDVLGVVLGAAAGAAASLFTVELVVEDEAGGLNTSLTWVVSQLSGFHQVTDELGLGVLVGAEVGAVVGALLGGAVVPVGALVGVGLTGGAVVPEGALDGRLDGADCCGEVGTEVGCGAPGVATAPGLLDEELGVLVPVLGAVDGAPAFGAAGFFTAPDPGVQAVEAALGDEVALAAFATVGITATPVAARKTAGSPIADTMRARLVSAASTRRSASEASSGVGTTARGLFTPPPRERSGASVSGSGSGPASSANTPEDAAAAWRSRRARIRASSTASRPAGAPAAPAGLARSARRIAARISAMSAKPVMPAPAGAWPAPAAVPPSR